MGAPLTCWMDGPIKISSSIRQPQCQCYSITHSCDSRSVAKCLGNELDAFAGTMASPVSLRLLPSMKTDPDVFRCFADACDSY